MHAHNCYTIAGHRVVQINEECRKLSQYSLTQEQKHVDISPIIIVYWSEIHDSEFLPKLAAFLNFPISVNGTTMYSIDWESAWISVFASPPCLNNRQVL